MKRPGGLRRRWILNTVGVVFILGLLCAFVVTGVLGANYYNAMESDLRYRAEKTTSFFTSYIGNNYSEFYQSCINYATSFDEKTRLELQFIDADGNVVATSFGNWMGPAPQTEDITKAMRSRGIESFVGKDPVTGEKILAVSSPMIYSSGEVIGVLRYVSSTRLVDRQILWVGGCSLAALSVVVLIVLFSSNYYIRSILIPVSRITDKAKRIAAGSYGSQIQVPYGDEIGDLADTINELSNQINQNEIMQREFISSLSHELRTPLTAITGWSETLLMDENMDADTRRGMTIIRTEAERLTEMVVELLDFNRLQDDRLHLSIGVCDIRSVFEDTVFMYSSRLSGENIRLDYENTDERIPEIPCDHKRMRQVFLNLLDNAAKHGGEGKRINASVSCDKHDVIFTIRDYGPGIPEDELPLVKKKFYKGSSKTRGTGIGLAVSDEIVAMHGGSLTLENASGSGTLVTVRLPISQ